MGDVLELETPIEAVKFPNFQQTSDKNMEQLLYKNHLQRLALTRFKSSLDEFKQKQEELENAKALYESKEKELREIYLKTLPYLDVIKDIPQAEEENLKEWDDSVSSSFGVLKKYLIHKPLTVVKDKTIYIAQEAIGSLPEHYQEKINNGISVVSDYVDK